MAWPVSSTRIAYQNPWIAVHEEMVQTPAGTPGMYGVVELRDAVFIVAVDERNRIALVTIDRHTVGESREIPAGGSDGQDPQLAAQRELREETGLIARSWQHLGTLEALNGIARAREHVFLARGPTLAEDAEDHRAQEGITRTEWVSLAEFWQSVACSRIRDSETIAAVALAAAHADGSVFADPT